MAEQVKVSLRLSSQSSFVPHVISELVKNELNIDMTYGQSTNITIGESCISGAHAVARTLIRLTPPTSSPSLYGNDDLEKAEVDHWLEYSVAKLTQQSVTAEVLVELDKVLESRVFLVGYHFSLADIALYGCLRVINQTMSLSSYHNLTRWFDYCGTWQAVKTTSHLMPLEEKAKQKDIGQYAEMPNAEMGEVVVRFPPEASGYLHIGHAKACLINQHYQLAYNGKLVMRFDDTNPEKEKEHFEKIILEDVAMLQVKPDIFTYSSDHFDTLMTMCERLLRDGKAFVEDTPPDQMKIDREAKRKSPSRDRSIEENLRLWEEMKKGSEEGLKCCVRGKMDYQSDNGALRDPTLYRCKLEPHPRTGTKYKVYPTYDFTISIVDSIEGVTHAMRTTEYRDRDDLYHWVVGNLGMRSPHLYEFSRLNLQNTVLSKRKLRWFVEEGIVTGWDDPRFPTVRGILRRGMTVEGLKNFIMAQGSSRAIVMMEWDKIWACNRKVIDPIAPRYIALLKSEVVTMVITGAKEEMKMQPKHPRNMEVGEKKVWYSKEVKVEGADAETLRNGEIVTLLNWGNVLVTKITRNEGRVESLEAELSLENTEFKNTQKLTWLAKSDSAQTTPTICYHFDHLISKGILKPDDNFKDYVNYNSKMEYEMMGDPCLREVKKGDIIQLQRRGFFICDQPYSPHSIHSGLESPCVLFLIPDGHSKPMPTSGSKKKKAEGPLLPEQPTKKMKSSDDHTPFTTTVTEAEELKEKAAAQGDKVRSLKANSASKEEIDAEIAILLSLKSQYKTLTGMDLVGKGGGGGGGGGGGKKEKASAGQKEKKEKEKKERKEKKEKKKAAEVVSTGSKVEEGEATSRKKQTKLGLDFKKEENLSEWYTQVITKAEMVEYYDVSGCYILRPWSYAIWEKIQAFFDAGIKEMGVENVYFPMFVSQSALEREKDHIADFAPEVAWVTRSGSSELAEPIAVRPTSETVMYPAVAKWVQSHRDLPIRINQWCNIVRWEFKHPQPFLRTREFLWQEGHGTFAYKDEAEAEVMDILRLYQRVYEELLAIPVVPGRKTEKEKFAGGDYTTTVEAYIAASGRAIQAATSHHLGQNFAKMFEIMFEHPEKEGEHEYAYQNSWGLTTRSIGVMTMVHGDNSGLVLPPRVATVQVIVVPCGVTASTTEQERTQLISYCQDTVDLLKKNGVRCRGDFRDNYSPGWKFYHWEQKGVPVRCEVGPQEMEKEQLLLVNRVDRSKCKVAKMELKVRVQEMLDDIHKLLFDKAKRELDAGITVVDNWDGVCKALDNGQLLIAPFCGDIKCEELIKKESARGEVVEAGAPAMGAKSLCIPFDPPRTLTPGTACIRPICKTTAKHYTMFGRSY